LIDTIGSVLCNLLSRDYGEFMPTGTVKWFNNNKGFGFIVPDDSSADLFAHYSSIEASGYKSLAEEDRVEFEIQEGPKGLQAVNIRVIGSDN